DARGRLAGLEPYRGGFGTGFGTGDKTVDGVDNRGPLPPRFSTNLSKVTRRRRAIGSAPGGGAEAPRRAPRRGRRAPRAAILPVNGPLRRSRRARRPPARGRSRPPRRARHRAPRRGCTPPPPPS